jgi:catechol-2,3-dioxygenase
MLGEHPVDVMLLATDLEATKDFYNDRIGLEVILESDDFVTFACGGDSRLVVTKSTTGSTEDATKASWRVDDLVSEASELRSRGVELEQVPGLEMVDGIADIGFALAAWFVDPARNSIGLLQLKNSD